MFWLVLHYRKERAMNEPAQFFVSPSGNLLYAPGGWSKKRYRFRGFGWRQRFAPWAGVEAIIIRY